MQLETVMVPIGDLLAYENNAKIHTPKQIEHIANSIRDFGFNDPIGVWTRPDGRVEIVTGHGAVEAAKTIGMDEVPCNFLDHLSDEERRAYCHVHNQTQLETSFDTDALIADMDNLNCDWDNYGFEAYTFDGYAPETDNERAMLADRFGISPFTVLDARSGSWQSRKRQWLSLGIRSELGRGGGGIRARIDGKEPAVPGGSRMPLDREGKWA